MTTFRHNDTLYTMNDGDVLYYCDRVRWYKVDPKNLPNYRALFNELRKGVFSLFIIRKNNTSTTLLETTK